MKKILVLIITTVITTSFASCQNTIKQDYWKKQRALIAKIDSMKNINFESNLDALKGKYHSDSSDNYRGIITSVAL